jgi:hypothetical protein
MKPYILKVTEYESGTTYYSLWEYNTGCLDNRRFTTCNLETAKRGVVLYTKGNTKAVIKVPHELVSEFENLSVAKIESY